MRFICFSYFSMFLYVFYMGVILLYGFDSNQMPQKMILHHHRISPFPRGGYTSTPFSVTTIFFWIYRFHTYAVVFCFMLVFDGRYKIKNWESIQQFSFVWWGYVPFGNQTRLLFRGFNWENWRKSPIHLRFLMGCNGEFTAPGISPLCIRMKRWCFISNCCPSCFGNPSI